MKNISTKINNSVIEESGFFKNIGAECKVLEDFIKNSVVAKVKGKEYIISNRLIYDVENLRTTCYDILTKSKANIRKEVTMKEIVCFEKYISIRYNVHSIDTGCDYAYSYTIYSVAGERKDKEDQTLKQFLESL